MRMKLGMKRFALAAVLPPMFLLACETDQLSSFGNEVGDSRAYGLWVPGPNDSCTAEVHNRYYAVGPDGLRYPTWHPPTDPSGCSFGHEHGRDPRGSDLFNDVGPMPFGHANQQLEIFDPANPRNEDHVGHKVEWENDIHLDFGDGKGGIIEVTCDVLAKLHQGTHSKDAFTNNLHELIYHIRCSDRTEMHITLMTAIGTPGEFVVSCASDQRVVVGPATPRNSPRGGGQRRLPDRSCVDRFMVVGPGRESDFESALHESWETHSTIKTGDGHALASFDPYFQVMFPSRFYDPTRPDGVGRPIEVCYEVTPSGERARGDECSATAGGTVTGITYNDARSAFNGVRRFMDVNGNRIDNEDGPEVWYSDPFGRDASRTPFPGSIRQWIAKVDNTGRQGHGPVIGRQRNHGGPGVHAPN